MAAGHCDESAGFGLFKPCHDCYIKAPARDGIPRSAFPDGSDAGWSSPVARQAHNLKVVGSNPTPATISKSPVKSETWSIGARRDRLGVGPFWQPLKVPVMLLPGCSQLPPPQRMQ